MDFALLAMPRSGTTWASVWLMDDALCLHDPLSDRTPDQLLAFNPGRRWGVACTGLWWLPDIVTQAACPVVVIDRNLEEVQRSLVDTGLPALPAVTVERFDLLPWPRFNYDDLFDEDGAQEIWSILRPDKPMDVARWKVLCGLNIQPDFQKWKPDPQVMRETLARMMRSM